MNTVLALNAALALGLFVLCRLLGQLQSGSLRIHFSYGTFGFSDADGNRSFANNFFSKAIIPTIYLAVCCAVAQALHWAYIPTFWLIFPMYWGIRAVFLGALNRWGSIHLPSELAAFAVSLCLEFVIFRGVILPLLRDGLPIFIPPEELRSAVWYAILAYLAKLCWDISKERLTAEALYPEAKKAAIALSRYDKLSKKFGRYIARLIKAAYPQYQPDQLSFACLVYAVMIFEDFNRPPIPRTLERLLKLLRGPGHPMTLGIMQITTDHIISDEESIALGIQKLLQTFLDETNFDPVRAAIEDYNPDQHYVEEVCAIYDILWGTFGG